MTIQYTIEINGSDVRITQTIDQTQSNFGRPVAVEKTRPGLPADTIPSGTPSAKDKETIALPTFHTQDVAAAAAAGTASAPGPKTGGLPISEKPGTGGSGGHGGLTIVLGPVVLPMTCPRCSNGSAVSRTDTDRTDTV